MAITLDGLTPAAVDLTNSTSATAVTASFSPPAGSTVVICVNLNFVSSSGTTPTVTVTDSLSNAYTAGPVVYDGAYVYSGIFTYYYAGAPGSITVTATRSRTQAALFDMVTQVLDGAASSQSGAASGTTFNASGTDVFDHSITTTTAGSRVIVAASPSGNIVTISGGYTDVGVTDTHVYSDTVDQRSAATGYYQTVSPGAVTLGWECLTGAPSWAFSWAALEILPATAGGANPAPATVTASAAFPAPSVSTGSPTPATVPASAAFPAPTVTGGGGSSTLNDSNVVSDGPYNLQANEYNSAAAFDVTYTAGPPYGWNISTSAISVSTSGAPGAYPSIYSGNHWGYSSSQGILPVQVSAVTPGQITANYNVTLIGTGNWDCAFDNWCNVLADPTSNSTNGLEWMIWLAHGGSIGPAGSLNASNVIIGGNTYNVWYNGSTTVSFLFVTQQTSVSLDMYPFLQYMVSRGWLSSSWYFTDIEAGFEIWTGGQGLTCNSFSVTETSSGTPALPDSAGAADQIAVTGSGGGTAGQLWDETSAAILDEAGNPVTEEVPTGVTHVNSASITGNSATSPATITIPSGTGIQAGDLIVVAVNTKGVATPAVTVKDSVNNVNFTQLRQDSASASASRYLTSFSYVTPQAIADGATITVTSAGVTQCGGAVDVFRGCSGAVNQAATGQANGTSSTSDAAPALGADAGTGTLVLTLAGANSTATSFTAGAPFTTGSHDASCCAAIGYVLSASGSSTYASTWTIANSTSAGQTVSFAAGAILPTLAEAGAAADQLVIQAISIPAVVFTAPRRAPGPPPAPVRAQIFTVPQGSGTLADAAGAADTMLAGTAATPLADTAGAADAFTGFEGASLADPAAAADELAVSASASPALPEMGGSADALTVTVQVAPADYGAAADASRTAGLTQAETAGAADTLTASVAVHVTDKAAALDTYGTEPAIGASGGATIPRAAPGTSQVAVAAPGSSRWYYLGSYGTITALTYSYTCPGGCDSMTCTLMVPASYRNQIMNPGWQVRITRGGHTVWTGKMDEPIPTAQGWNFTAVGTGMRGTDFLTIYTSTWPTNQPDESINNAISRGLPWVNPGVGSPAGIWLGQGVDSGASTITALLNLICTRGGLTWYVNSQPGGMPGDDLSVFPLPTTPNRLLVATTPVPRTLGGDLNTVYLRYQITADNTSSSSSSTAPATYGLAVAQNAASVAMHGELETFIDISDVGVLSQAAAQAVGQNVLQIYQRASFAGPFTGSYGQLLNMGGTPVDPGCDQAGSVCRLILTDFGAGGELVPGPIQFIVGSYSWNDFSGTFSLSPMNTLDQSLQGMLQMENTMLVPVTVASGG